jgi:hypothetical protein
MVTDGSERMKRKRFLVSAKVGSNRWVWEKKKREVRFLRLHF